MVVYRPADLIFLPYQLNGNWDEQTVVSRFVVLLGNTVKVLVVVFTHPLAPVKV